MMFDYFWILAVFAVNLEDQFVSWQYCRIGASIVALTQVYLHLICQKKARKAYYDIFVQLPAKDSPIRKNYHHWTFDDPILPFSQAEEIVMIDEHANSMW
jgi:hypothetical protein